MTHMDIIMQKTELKNSLHLVNMTNLSSLMAFIRELVAGNAVAERAAAEKFLVF